MPHEQQQQHDPGDEQRVLHGRHGGLLAGEREQQIQLQRTGRGRQRGADDQVRGPDAVLVDCVLKPREVVGLDELAQPLRHRGERPDVHRIGVRLAAADAGQHRLEGARGGTRARRGRGRDLLERVLQARVQRLRGLAADPDQFARGGVGKGLGLLDRGAALGVQQPFGDLVLQDHAEHEHHGRGQRERRDRDAELQRVLPQFVERHRAAACENHDPGRQPSRGAGGGAEPPRETGHRTLTAGLPCTRLRAPSAPPRGAPGPSPPSSAGAGRARSPAGCRPRAGSPTPAPAAPRG